MKSSSGLSSARSALGRSASPHPRCPRAWTPWRSPVSACGRWSRDCSRERGGLVGLSQETTCYLSLEYFSEDDRFADFIVHEAAHIFHNWKREYAGMPHTRNKEWLLQIEYRKREEFAYSCEFYGRILALSSSRAERVNLAEECVGALRLGRRIDQALVVDSLREAAAARNGWKQILKRCATA